MAVTLKLLLTNQQADFFGYDHGAEVYLVHYDIEAEPFLADIRLSNHLADAIVWPHVMSAMEAWRAQCKHTPIRETDGKPNRPLTAFTVTIEFVER